MVELQSCASLVNASALCAIEQEVKGESVNVIAEISAELQRERQRNAELMERISLLEAQIQEKDKESLQTDRQGSCFNATERRFRKFKRQKIEISSDRTENGKIIKWEMALKTKHDTELMSAVELSPEDHLVNWTSIDDTQFLHFDKFKDGDSAADFDERNDSCDEDDAYCEEDDTNTDHKGREVDENLRSLSEVREQLHEGVNQEMNILCLESSSGSQVKPTFLHVSQITNGDCKKDCIPLDTQPPHDKSRPEINEKKDSKKIGGSKTPEEILTYQKEAYHTGRGRISLQKNPAKVPFCPKEIKRMLESDALLLKNAQSHTIRKIIVFASLSIRHGCEDMYDLDFNHFSILRKGEPYVSPKNPGEHVLYENPGVRRKVFYPNRENPTLCPVQILDEEKATRPSDTGCPSCLFLCIKYGGRTRNLPQNEYVRQRMGRNKLKSFGPVMCRMAMLVHIRSGSFFFKALGIALLFMDGFPDDLVQRETKYRNLDLLQKYYRTDEEAKEEELFLSHPLTCKIEASPHPQQLPGKPTSIKSKGKKQTSSSKPHSLPRSSVQQPANSSSAPPVQFGLMGYTSIQNHAMPAFQSMPFQTPADAPQVANTVVDSPFSTNVSYHNQSSYHMFPPQPTNAFMPMIYWPPPTALPPGPYPTTYGYQSFPSAANYISINPQPYYNHPSCSPFTHKIVEGRGKIDVASEADSDLDSSSSSTEPKEA